MTNQNDDFNAFDRIELFGLTENGSKDLPFPCEEEQRNHILQPAFSALCDPLMGTALECEVEPIAHGLAALMFRRKAIYEKQLDRHKLNIAGLIRSADGSEVLETQLEAEQSAAALCRDMLDALETLSEAAAQSYENNTGRAFIPSAGSRLPQKHSQTGAILEAKEWLDAEAEKERNKYPDIQGRALIVQGPKTWLDASTVWNTLDKIAARYREHYAENLILYTRGQKSGVEAIAAAWARARKSTNIIFRPQWDKYKKAAPYKAMDQMFEDELPFVLGGCLIFGADALAAVMAKKADEHCTKILHITADRDPMQDAKGKSKSDYQKK